MLTPKERLFNSLRRNPVDRPPCICPGGMMNMVVEEVMNISGYCWPAAHTDAEMMANLAAAVSSYTGFENYGVPFCMTVEAEAMGAPVDIGSKINEPISFDFITSVRQLAGTVQDKAIMGNVSTYALEIAGPEKVRIISNNCLANGVNILSPACGIGPRTPLENIKAMVAAARAYGERCIVNG